MRHSATSAGSASASLEDDIPNGRLGYKWTPEPPSRPLTQSEELGLEVAKYGGGGLIGMAYHAGVMPPNVPVWRFHYVD